MIYSGLICNIIDYKSNKCRLIKQSRLLKICSNKAAI